MRKYNKRTSGLISSTVVLNVVEASIFILPPRGNVAMPTDISGCQDFRGYKLVGRG